MKNKYISTQSNELLSYFNEKNQACFNYSLAYKALPQSKGSALRELLSDMTKRGLLMRLKEGVYYIIPYEQKAETYMPDWHLMAAYLVNDAPYYIGYYSALQIHNLITQPSLKEQIVVSKQIRPAEIKIKEVPFQFIYHNEKHFFGSKKIWIDNFNKVLCSDLEKTIIDCLFKPDYAGGIVEVAKAIYIAKNNINYKNLLDYATQFESQAVIKRLGFLLEVLEINAPIIQALQQMKTASYVVLDTELPKQGKRISRWRIQQNLEIETIKSAIYTWLNREKYSKRPIALGFAINKLKKDYILSWILLGISKHEQLSKALVFKGGTVLKKVYFEDYRFSEDLDFTLIDAELSNALIFEWFNELFTFIKEDANISLDILDDNEHEDGGINFYIRYVGPLGGQGSNKKVKVDISRSEKMVFEPIMQKAIIDYTDMEEYKLLCYPLEEVLVEKLRSVMQRMQARDFYDIWYLLEVHSMEAVFYVHEFESKCRNKNLMPTDFHKKLEERLPQYKGRWESSMREQIKNLPDFDQVAREVQGHLKKLFM